MNKSQRFLRSMFSTTAVFVVFSFVFLASGAYAASTIGTNMSTTGTFLVNPAANSTTSVRFQNAAGTNYFFADSTNSRIGIGAAPSTTFEVQGTASASYLMTINSLQVAGVASVAYSRFGTGETGHSLAAADDVLFTGLVEFDDNAFFDAKASISGNFQTAGRFILGDNGDTGAINTSDWDISSTGAMTGIGAITADGHFSGTTASLSGNFQTAGRFIADTAASHSFAGDLIVTSNLIVGSATASSSGGAYVAEFSKAGTASMYFGSSDATLGSCLQLTDTAGNPVYARVNVGGTSFTVSTVSCR